MPHKKGETRRKYDREYYKRKRAESKWIVYKIEDYVGMTKYWKKRMDEHRKQGRDTTKAKPLFKFNRPEPATIVEAIYHWMGYKGCPYGKK